MTHDDWQDHEPALDIMDIGGQAFLEAIEKHSFEEDNRDLIHETFDAIVGDALASGRVFLTKTERNRLVRDHLWAALNLKAGRATQTVLKQLVAGQASIAGVDALLDVPLTAGQNRRTTVRHLNRTDIDRMLAEREKNLQKQKAAYAEFADDIAATLLDWLDRYGSIPAAIAAGAVRLSANPGRVT